MGIQKEKNQTMKLIKEKGNINKRGKKAIPGINGY